jgi:hypothetical protein
VRSRRSWTLPAVLMTAVMLPGLSMFIFGQAAPAGQTGVPPLPAAGAQGGAPAGAPAAGGRGGRGGGGARGGAAAAPAAPAPHFPDGTPRLGALPGQTGLWNGGGGGTTDVPYQPWAKAISTYRRNNQFEPHTRCKPSGGPRQFLTPYGVEIVDLPELKRIMIMDIGGPHTFRTIYMDGRPHPKDLAPSFYGHSIGTWDKDTLVVDTIGFNEKFWMDRGEAPHTEKLHMIEKFTRTDMNTMQYELTVDDPGAYTATWTRSSAMRFGATSELFEYVCQDNNHASSLLVGSEQTSVDRSSQIAP